MVVRRPSTARSRRTRIDLTRAARDVVRESGGIDADDVAARAGVSPATFYSHFSTHDDAMAAALDLSLEAIISAAEQIFTIEAMLDIGVDAMLNRLVIALHSVFVTESPVLQAALARVKSHPPTRFVYLEKERRAHRHLAHHVALGQRAGLLRAGDADHRATALLVLLQGIDNPLLINRGIQPVADDLRRSLLAVLAAD